LRFRPWLNVPEGLETTLTLHTRRGLILSLVAMAQPSSTKQHWMMQRRPLDSFSWTTKPGRFLSWIGSVEACSNLFTLFKFMLCSQCWKLTYLVSPLQTPNCALHQINLGLWVYLLDCVLSNSRVRVVPDTNMKIMDIWSRLAGRFDLCVKSISCLSISKKIQSLAFATDMQMRKAVKKSKMCVIDCREHFRLMILFPYLIKNLIQKEIYKLLPSSSKHGSSRRGGTTSPPRKSWTWLWMLLISKKSSSASSSTKQDKTTAGAYPSIKLFHTECTSL